MSRLLAPGPGGPTVGALPRGRSDFGDSAGCWSGVVRSLRSGGKGAGTPTASTAARWPLRHPSRGHCHHRNRRWSRVGGPEDVAATQPARSGGHSAQKNHPWLLSPAWGLHTPPCPPVGHLGLGRAASLSPLPSSSWDPLEFALPSSGGHWLCLSPRLCQALPSRAARSCQAALLPGAQTQKLEGLP